VSLQPLYAAKCSAVHLPDGAARRIGDQRPQPTRPGRATEGAPAAVFSVHVGAHVDERFDDSAIVIDRRNHQRRGSTPAHGGAGEGVSPDK
jgi:hypothetical protein